MRGDGCLANAAAAAAAAGNAAAPARARPRWIATPRSAAATQHAHPRSHTDNWSLLFSTIQLLSCNVSCPEYGKYLSDTVILLDI